MNSLSINVFYALKCSVQQLMSSQVCAFYRSILSEKTVCLAACVWSRIPPHYSCLLWSWETDLYLDLLKAFDKKRAVNMIVKFRLHSLAWEWIGSMGRHWHPRMHNQTPCWCYAVLLCAPPENQEKVGQISHFSNFIFMRFYLGKSMKMCMKVWVYYFFCWH